MATITTRVDVDVDIEWDDLDDEEKRELLAEAGYGGDVKDRAEAIYFAIERGEPGAMDKALEFIRELAERIV